MDLQLLASLKVRSIGKATRYDENDIVEMYYCYVLSCCGIINRQEEKII